MGRAAVEEAAALAFANFMRDVTVWTHGEWRSPPARLLRPAGGAHATLPRLAPSGRRGLTAPTWGPPCIPPSAMELTPVTSRPLPRGWLRPVSHSCRITDNEPQAPPAGGAPRRVWPPLRPTSPPTLGATLGRGLAGVGVPQGSCPLLSTWVPCCLPHAAPSLTLPEGACLPVGYLSPWIAAPGQAGHGAGTRQMFGGGFNDRLSISLQCLPEVQFLGQRACRRHIWTWGAPWAFNKDPCEERGSGSGSPLPRAGSQPSAACSLWHRVTTLPSF